jgi:hypothetical protein
MKRDVINGMSEIVSFWSRCNKPFNQSTRCKFTFATVSAIESKEYLNTSIGRHTTTSTNRMNVSNTTKFFLDDICRIEWDLDSCRAAVLGCRAAFVCNSSEDEDLEDFSHFWEELQKRSMELGRSIAKTNERFVSTIKPTDLPKISNADEEYDNNLQIPLNQMQEYTTNGVTINNIICRNDHPQQFGKILVFSGSGTPKLTTSRNRDQRLTSTPVPPQHSNWTTFSKLSLIEELKQHIKAMPSADEIDVSSVPSEDIQVSQSKVQFVNTSIPTYSTPTNSGYLFEDLKMTLAGFQRCDDSESFSCGEE